MLNLWARDGTGAVVEFPGRPLTDGSAFGPATNLVTSGTPWATCKSYTSSATGTHSICGPILAKFLAIGGTAEWGYPATDVTSTADGGRYVDFRSPSGTKTDRTISWSNRTGAWSVEGRIFAKWTSMGREASVLRYPVADERDTGVDGGAYSVFSGGGKAGGAIYYTTTTGAHEIRGNILIKYRELGGPVVLGHPNSDELATVSRSGGRYQELRRPGSAADDGSIYWTYEGGAWSVVNGIRKSWLAGGGHGGPRGFPVSDEYETLTGWRSDFENGTARWYESSGFYEERSNGGTSARRSEFGGGDVNGDGHDDMISVFDYGNATAGLWTLRADSGGGFTLPREVWSSAKGGFDPARAKWAAGDVNGDELADAVAVYGYADGTMALWSFLTQPDGSMKPLKSTTTTAGTWAWDDTSLTVGDVNGDGRQDAVLVVRNTTGVLTVLHGTARTDGGFGSLVQSWKSAAGGWQGGSYEMGDANGDGREDMIALSSNASGQQTLHTFVSKSDASATAPVGSVIPDTTWPDDGHPSNFVLAVSDLNGDGRADATAIRHSWSSLRVCLMASVGATADGTFDVAHATTRTTAGACLDPVSGDFNADGKGDVAFLSSVGYSWFTSGEAAYTYAGRTDGSLGTSLRSLYYPDHVW